MGHQMMSIIFSFPLLRPFCAALYAEGMAGAVLYPL